MRASQAPGSRRAFVIQPEKFDDVRGFVFVSHGDGDPARFRKGVVRARAARGNQFIAQAARERKVSEAGVKMPRLANPNDRASRRGTGPRYWVESQRQAG